jgi:hypothetical protein
MVVDTSAVLRRGERPREAACRVLLLLAYFGKDATMEPVIPNISQEILAARVGTTRSRINFFMNKFRKLGFIEYNGSLKVHSSLLNVIVHD